MGTVGQLQITDIVRYLCIKFQHAKASIWRVPLHSINKWKLSCRVDIITVSVRCRLHLIRSSHTMLNNNSNNKDNCFLLDDNTSLVFVLARKQCHLPGCVSAHSLKVLEKRKKYFIKICLAEKFICLPIAAVVLLDNPSMFQDVWLLTTPILNLFKNFSKTF